MNATLVGQLLLVVAMIAGCMLAVALGVLAGRKFRSAPPEDLGDAEDGAEGAEGAEERVVAVDPRPLPDSPVALTPQSDHCGEVWLALGPLPVSARQLALVMAKLPVGTLFTGLEPDPVNGDGAIKAGFTHWSFAAANGEKYPNGPRLWVSWANDNEPVISWPLVDD